MEWPTTSILARLSGPARAALLRLGTEVALPAGRRILRQGDDGDAVYVLLAGAVRVSVVDGDREPLLAIRAAGDLVGEMSVLRREPRSATVVTCTATIARVLSGTAFRAYLREHPDAAIEVAGMLGARLRWANERRVAVAALDAPARVRRVLVALAETYGRVGPDGRDLGAPLTQEDIARWPVSGSPPPRRPFARSAGRSSFASGTATSSCWTWTVCVTFRTDTESAPAGRGRLDR